ncbi:MAG: hypothetical protein LC721_10900 [Actinobacteria bacterium]|nr:hypothetical protein [Actinomycetota bacterium]
MLVRLATDGRLRVERTEVVGSYPDTALVVVFRVGDRPCLFAVTDRIWDEEDPETFDAIRSARYAVLRWEEALDTGEPPTECDPDEADVTGLNLWDDW